MKPTIFALTALIAAGLIAGFVAPPDSGTAAETSPATVDALQANREAIASTGTTSSPVPGGATVNAEGIAVSLGDIAGVVGLVLAGAVTALVWLRSRDPVRRITRQRQYDDSEGSDRGRPAR